MKISEAFPSNFLKAQDLNGHVCKAVIADIKVQDVGGQGRAEDHKPVLLLQGKTKGIVLNKTNATILSEAYGDETEQWRGKPVEITPEQTTFQGRLVPCIRLRVPPPADSAEKDVNWG